MIVRRGVVLLALLLHCAEAHAAAPRETWRSLVTEHFRIHYHEGTAAKAQAVAHVAEPAYEELGRLFNHVADTPIHLVVTDETDSPNGFAEISPQSVVTLFLAVPDPFSSLGDYEDFLRLLVVHELTHIIHLDTVHGIPVVVNRIIGRQWIPNAVQPTWFIEGVAVWAEGRLTAGGRSRSAFIDAWVRSLVMEDRFPDLAVLSHYTRRHPGGGFPWYMGGRFISFIATRHGDDKIACMSHAYGSRIVPYAVNLVAKRCTGETFVELWEHWRDYETNRVATVTRRVEAEGEVQGEAGWSDEDLALHLRWSPDGSRLAWIATPRDSDREIVVQAEDGSQVRFRTNDGQGAFTNDQEHYVAAVRDTYSYVFSYGDIEVIDLQNKGRWRRTKGQRLSTPDVSKQNQIVAQQQDAGQTQLVTLSVFGVDTPKPLGVMQPGEQVFHPRWSPDGQSVVAVVSDPSTAARRLEIFDAHSGQRRRLACEDVRCMHPAFSSDGAFVYYSKEHDGLFDIWRVRSSGGAPQRMTRVKSSAHFAAPRPRPSGPDELHYGLTTASGWTMRVRPTTPVAVEMPSAETSTLTVQMLEPQPRERTRANLLQDSQTVSSEPYQSWESLLPKAWLPMMGEDGQGTTLGLTIWGADAVRIHRWNLSVWGGLSTKRLGYSIGYSNRAFKIPFSLSSSLRHQTRFLNFGPRTSDEDRLETSFRFNAGLSVPLTRWDIGSALFFNYAFENRRGENQTTLDPLGDPPRRRGDLRLSSIGLAWSVGTVRGFAESLGSARGAGFDLSVRWFDPIIGSNTRLFSVEARGRAYWSLPWAKHHVLAVKGGMGTSVGTLARRSVYGLGGLPVRNIFTDIINQRGVGTDSLRGYPVAQFRGNSFYTGTAEYRLPLLTFEEGIHTVPAFVDRLWMAAFTDFGNTPQGSLRIEETKVGIGAEVRLNFSFAYLARYLLRVGYARGLQEGGIHNAYIVMGGLF